MKIAFLDRDGTIIREYPEEQWRAVEKPEFLEGAIQALQEIREKGYQIIIITNQYLIDEGIITQEQYESVTEQIKAKAKENGVEILDIFYCPHSRQAGCDCCKPKTEMVDQALKKYPEIKLEESFFVGDSVCDMELAEKLSLQAFGIKLEPEGKKFKPVNSLLEAVSYL